MNRVGAIHYRGWRIQVLEAGQLKAVSRSWLTVFSAVNIVSNSCLDVLHALHWFTVTWSVVHNQFTFRKSSCVF